MRRLATATGRNLASPSPEGLRKWADRCGGRTASASGPTLTLRRGASGPDDGFGLRRNPCWAQTCYRRFLVRSSRTLFKEESQMSRATLNLFSILLFVLLNCRPAPQRVERPKESQGMVCAAEYVHQAAVDQLISAFTDRAQALGLISLRFEVFNANGDPKRARQLADQLCRDEKCKVIYAVATPMAQAAKSSCGDRKPIVYGAVTDPLSAGLVGSTNITGTSDVWPYRLQMELIAFLFGPDVSVGILYNPNEANTLFAMDKTRKAAGEVGLKLVEAAVVASEEITSSLSSISEKVDVVYIPADNTVMSSARKVVDTCDKKHIPVIAGDPETFKIGAVAALGVSYSALGRINADQIAEILSGKEPAAIPAAASDQHGLFLNHERLHQYGIDPTNVEKWYKSRIHKN